MSEREVMQQAEQNTPYQAGIKENIAVFSQQALEQAINGLSRYGGFGFLESVIDGIQNVNPERKARKKMFLVFIK